MIFSLSLYRPALNVRGPMLAVMSSHPQKAHSEQKRQNLYLYVPIHFSSSALSIILQKFTICPDP